MASALTTEEDKSQPLDQTVLTEENLDTLYLPRPSRQESTVSKSEGWPRKGISQIAEQLSSSFRH